MKTNERVIFDLDGTLYSFKGTQGNTFVTSDFYRDLQLTIRAYVAKKLAVRKDEAEQIIRKVDITYDGELSIGFEEMFGIDRYEYYAQTWGLMDPVKYIDASELLSSNMLQFTGRAVLLTSAPRVWVDKVLKLLGITEVFGDCIISGEPDIRKPSKEVFEQARDLLDTEYKNITSIGDQNYSDIEPAKALGMKTIIINSKQWSADQRADSISDALIMLKGENDEI